MSLWFSASAAIPQLTTEWHLSRAEQSWLTMSVQIGFVAGALFSALLNVSDRIRPEKLIALSALIGAVANGAIALFAREVLFAIALRFAVGFTLAGVYPPGMKLVATWCKSDRGFGIGLLVGALTIGSALPHLFHVAPFASWRVLIGASSIAALIGASIVILFVRPGPHFVAATHFAFSHATRAFSDRAVRLVNFGYLGHMWELYAMWAWAPLLLLQSYSHAGYAATHARAAGFAVIAIGGAGSLVAGVLADRIGRTTITIASLIVSGSCAAIAGLCFGSPILLTAVCLLWGFAVVADSAQFSTAATELGDPRYAGTTLTMQLCAGFLLTMLTIRLVPLFVDRMGWTIAFAFLAIGPIFGIASMARLRTLPEAEKLASGKK